jgi:hypothetical protein
MRDSYAMTVSIHGSEAIFHDLMGTKAGILSLFHHLSVLLVKTVFMPISVFSGGIRCQREGNLNPHLCMFYLLFQQLCVPSGKESRPQAVSALSDEKKAVTFGSALSRIIA